MLKSDVVQKKFIDLLVSVGPTREGGKGRKEEEEEGKRSKWKIHLRAARAEEDARRKAKPERR
eukprot:753710-Hanusia_phi.AAC.2